MGKLLTILFVISRVSLYSMEFFVSLGGNAQNPGTKNLAWDLQTALYHPSVVGPGDTISILEGRYFGQPAEGEYLVAGFICKIKGTFEKPIIVRAYPGQRVVLDGANRVHPTDRSGGLDSHVLGILGDYTWFIGFEITDSSPFSRAGINTGQTWRVNSMVSIGTGLKFINLLVYDTGNGLGPFSGCVDCEAYGNFIFYNGWSNTGVRGHGEGIYAQNITPTKFISDNVIFRNFDSGMILYGSKDATIDNFDIDGNIIFENGVINDEPNGWGMLFGKNTTTTGRGRNYVIQNNLLFNKFDYIRSNNIDLGYQSGLENVLFRNNYSVGFNAIKYNIPVVGLNAYGNTLISHINGTTSQQISRDSNSIYTNSALPQQNVIFSRKNKYEEGRGHIIVYNWEQKASEEIDITGLQLQDNTEYEIYDVQNITGSPIYKFVYQSSKNIVMLPLTLKEVAKVVGDSVPRPAVHTDKTFNVFLIKKSYPIVSTTIKTNLPFSWNYKLHPSEKQIIIESSMGHHTIFNLFNSFGQIIINGIIINNSSISYADFPAGIYILKIKNNLMEESVKLELY